MPFHLVEPHPSVLTDRSKAYFPTGIGGAGNFRSYQTSSLTTGPTATGPASLASLSPPPTSARMLTGRGGAGNAYVRRSPATTGSSTKPKPSTMAPRPGTAADRATPRRSMSSEEEVSHRQMFSFDEELEREQRMFDNASRTPVYHIGRGGAGNAFASAASTQGRNGSVASQGSGHSTASEGKRRLGSVVDGIRRTLSRN